MSHLPHLQGADNYSYIAVLGRGHFGKVLKIKGKWLFSNDDFRKNVLAIGKFRSEIPYFIFHSLHWNIFVSGNSSNLLSSL